MKTRTLALLIVAVTVVGVGLLGTSAPTNAQSPDSGPPCLPHDPCASANAVPPLVAADGPAPGLPQPSVTQVLVDLGPPCLPGEVCIAGSFQVGRLPFGVHGPDESSPQMLADIGPPCLPGDPCITRSGYATITKG